MIDPDIENETEEQLPGHFKAKPSDWAFLSQTAEGRRVMREIEEHFDLTSPIYKPHVIISNPESAKLLGQIKAGMLEVFQYMQTQAKPDHAEPKP